MDQNALASSFVEAMEYERHREPMQAQTAKSLTAISVWGTSITAILRVLLDKAKEMGREYRPQLEAAAQAAVDKLVALDLPWIPDSIEGTIDEATKQLGYSAIKTVLDAVLAE